MEWTICLPLTSWNSEFNSDSCGVIFFPGSKLCMLRLSSTGNCYQLLSNTQIEWSQHYLTLIKERGKHLKQQNAIDAKFPIHFTNLSTKDCAFIPYLMQLYLQIVKLRQHDPLSLTLSAWVGQTWGLLRIQEVLRHTDTDIYSGSCLLPPCKQAVSSTYLTQVHMRPFSLCN